jgi:hypothetical protein
MSGLKSRNKVLEAYKQYEKAMQKSNLMATTRILKKGSFYYPFMLSRIIALTLSAHSFLGKKAS